MKMLPERTWGLASMLALGVVVWTGCNVRDDASKWRTSGQEMQLVESSVLDLDDPTKWSNVDETSEEATRGAVSFEVSPQGYTVFESVSFATERAPDQVAFDLKLPPNPPNPWWFGQAQAFLECPQAGVYNAFVGHFELTGQPTGEFFVVKMNVERSLQTRLQGGCDELVVRLVLNVPASGQTYLMDNLRLNEPVRFATFNVSLNRSNQGDLANEFADGQSAQGRQVAETIQRAQPDVILLNEFDYDPNAPTLAADLFRENYLEVSQNGQPVAEYPYVFVAPSNTGIPSGHDLNNDGTIGGPDDAFGFGFHEGQYGMVIFSKYPIDEDEVRTFQTFLWADMPSARLPLDGGPDRSWYGPDELADLRLSSKSHWDVPIRFEGRTIHALAAHPTPPVFDGPEDRNGLRNADEIRLWADYVTPGAGEYIYDDQGRYGGLEPGADFVILGDYNADPFDGDSSDHAALQLTDNPFLNNSVVPSSEGGADAAEVQAGANLEHLGDPRADTGDFGFAGEGNPDGEPGNLRVDYVLPAAHMTILQAHVFWPVSTDALFPLVAYPLDHRMVYVDLR